MSHNDFDDIFKNKLEGLDTPDHLMPNWERMEQAIIEDSNKDQAFDEQVKRKLEHLTIPSLIASNWDTLYELIDTRIQRKKAILTGKAFELAILGLLFLTAWNLQVFENHRTPVQFALENESQKIDILSNEENTLYANTIIEHSEEIKEASISTSKEATKLNTSQPRELSATNNQAFTSRNIAKEVIAVNFVDVQEKELSGLAYMQTVDLREKINPTVTENIDVSELQIASASIAGISTNLVDRQVVSIMPILQKIPVSSKAHFFAGLGVNLENNVVKSGLRESITRSRNAEDSEGIANNIQTQNLSLQAELGVKYKRFTVSTGFNYQQIMYSPSIQFTSGSLYSDITETNIKSLKYDLFTIPLSVSYDVVRYKSWALSVQGGISANAFARADQDISQKVYKGTRVTEVPAADIDRSVVNFSFQEGLLDEPSVSPNRIWNSLFYRARIGAGIDKKVGPRTTIYTNASYNYHLPAFNGNETDFRIGEQINSVSIGIGVRQFFG